MNQLRALQSFHPNSNANNDPSHEYVDAVVTNNSTNTGVNASIEPIPIVFNQIKTSNIIDDCSQYYLSVIRWSVETSLPIIIPTMKIGLTPTEETTGETEYYVNMIFKSGSTLPVYANFTGVGDQIILDERTDMTIRVPLNPQKVEDYLNNPYYYLDSVQSFLNLVNEAYGRLFAPIKTAGGSNLAEELPPIFTWDPEASKICLSVTRYFVRNVEKPTDATIFMSMSTSLYNLLNTFNTVRINSNPANTDRGADYIFNLTSLGGLNVSSSGGTTNPVVTYNYIQESSSVPSWSPVSSLVFVTNSIPVNATHSGTPQFQQNNNLGVQIGSSLSQNATASVLTDFEIPMETGVEYRNISYYSPTSEYRLFDFVSNQQLNNLNIQIFWKDKYGQLHPLTLRQNASASIKLMLRKKDFNGV